MPRRPAPSKSLAATRLAPLGAAIASAQKTWSDIQKRIEAALHLEGATGDCVVDPYAVVAALSEPSVRKYLASEADPHVLGEIEAWAESGTQTALRSFDDDLRRYCAAQGWKLAGRWPTYVVEGYLQVSVSPQDRTCTVGAQRANTLFFPMVASLIAADVSAESLRVKGAEAFIDQCELAYKRSLQLATKTAPAPVSVGDLYRELVVVLQSPRFWKTPKAASFTEYGMDHLARDLARALSQGNITTRSGMRLEVMPTAFPRDGVTLVLAEGARIVGHVRFVEAIA